MKERFADDPLALVEATHALQKQHGPSPFDRVPLLTMGIQLPILALFFQAIGRVASSGGAFYWVSSLARPDAIHCFCPRCARRHPSPNLRRPATS